jgi:hypothetical protein
MHFASGAISQKSSLKDEPMSPLAALVAEWIVGRHARDRRASTPPIRATARAPGQALSLQILRARQGRQIERGKHSSIAPIMPGDPSLAISSGVEPDCVGACPERTFYSSWCVLYSSSCPSWSPPRATTASLPSTRMPRPRAASLDAVARQCCQQMGR